MKITLHWTAGTHSPNQHELECYHALIDGMGRVTKAHDFSKPLEHCWQENTDNIGISLCGMLDAHPADFGKYPITDKQIESLIETCAVICLLKDIKYWQVKTHAERAIDKNYFGCRWDLAILKPQAKINQQVAIDTGKQLRLRIEERIAELSGNQFTGHPLYRELTRNTGK